MKNGILKSWFLVAGLALVATACGKSEHSAPPPSKVDKGLVGVWMDLREVQEIESKRQDVCSAFAVRRDKSPLQVDLNVISILGNGRTQTLKPVEPEGSLSYAEYGQVEHSLLTLEEDQERERLNELAAKTYKINLILQSEGYLIQQSMIGLVTGQNYIDNGASPFVKVSNDLLQSYFNDAQICLKAEAKQVPSSPKEAPAASDKAKMEIPQTQTKKDNEPAKEQSQPQVTKENTSVVPDTNTSSSAQPSQSSTEPYCHNKYGEILGWMGVGYECVAKRTYQCCTYDHGVILGFVTGWGKQCKESDTPCE